MLAVDVNKPDLFALNLSTREDIALVMAFTHRVARHVGQDVYIAAIAVDGRRVGGAPLQGPPDGAVVRLGKEDADQSKALGEGRDIVLWPPSNQEQDTGLVWQHWRRSPQLHWAVLVDGRDTDGVVASLQATWSRRHVGGDSLGLIRSSVGVERKMAMLSYDGSFFSGRASADCWDFVFALLKEMGGEKLEIYEDERAG
jgi:hypothetical protein